MWNMASPRSIEVKVGLLILATLGLLAAFILVMGGINFQPKYLLRVGFSDPGGLQSGAPVRVAGVKVGSVEAMEFVGGGKDAKGVEQPMVYARVRIEKRYQTKITEGSVFYITTAGLLGEQYLAVDAGKADKPPLGDGASIRGLDPPRLDRVLAEAYGLLMLAVEGVHEHKDALRDVVVGLGKTLKGTGEFMEGNKAHLDSVVANADQLSGDAVDTLQEARRKYVDNPKIDQILANVDQLVASANRDVPPLLQDGRGAVADVRRVVNAVGSEEQVARIKSALDDVSTIASDAKVAVKDAKTVVSHIKQGRGSIGALLMDEQLFDDLQEMARDLKHNPWKFFWKE